MSSPESRAVRATFVTSAPPSDTPLEAQRRDWETAALQTPLPPGTTVTPAVIAGVGCEWIEASGGDSDGVLLHVHGGGFTSGSCITHRELAARLSAACGLRGLLVGYRLAPEHRFPAAIDDVSAVYRELIAGGMRAGQIVVGGDSAGAQIAVAAMLAARDQSLALPAAIVLISPWLDLALRGESIITRAGRDRLTTHDGLASAAGHYLGDLDPGDPRVSPVYADLRGLPPILIQAGDDEILLSDAQRLADSARRAGVEATLEVWPEMWHVWHAWAAAVPEARDAIARIGVYVRERVSV